MVIYIYRGAYRDKREELIRTAVRTYAEEEQRIDGAGLSGAPLLKTKDGKPYLEGFPVHFSISHTGDMWGCLVSGSNVGFDIQKIKPVDFNRLAERFFPTEEIEFVRDVGIEGFFDVWTRKEACIKYFGGGLLRDIKSFSVIRDGKPVEMIDYSKNRCHISSLELNEAVKCAHCCGTEGARVWTREIT